MLISASLGQIVQELLCFLYRLASTHKDYAVVLCCLGAKDALTKVLEKHSAQLLLACELRDLVTECEQHAQLYSNLTSSILAGCIQVRSLRVQAEGGGSRGTGPHRVPLAQVVADRGPLFPSP